MLAYLFWHVPSAGIGAHEYEIALRDFLSDLTSAPPLGFVSCTSYRISEIPWLSNQEGYEDWYLVGSSGALDALNEAAVDPKRWDTHAAVASKMRSGHGGLYRHLYGDEQALGGASTLWLTRPQRIRYEDPLQKMIDGSAGFLSCWRRQMVLGPGDEFMIIGTSQFKVSVPQGWRARTVERAILPTATRR